MADFPCIGNAAVDLIARTMDDSPPLGGVRSFESLALAAGGCAVNRAIALARMGLQANLIVKLGNDWLGRFPLDEARALGVDCQREHVGCHPEDAGHGPLSGGSRCARKARDRSPLCSGLPRF